MNLYLDHYRATDSLISSVYFLSLIIIGQFVLMNLFISILIENFEQISVRNDIVKRLTDLKRGSSYEIIKQIVCFWRKKVKKDDKNTKQLLDDMMNEDQMEE
jgi:hypothetical protein